MVFDWVWNVLGLNGGGWVVVMGFGLIVQLLFFAGNCETHKIRPALLTPLMILAICLLPVEHLVALFVLVGGAIYAVGAGLWHLFKYVRSTSPRWFQEWKDDTKLMIREAKTRKLKAQRVIAEQRSLSPVRMTGTADDKALSLVKGD